jgi:hypothetical protein
VNKNHSLLKDLSIFRGNLIMGTGFGSVWYCLSTINSTSTVAFGSGHPSGQPSLGKVAFLSKKSL